MSGLYAQIGLKVTLPFISVDLSYKLIIGSENGSLRVVFGKGSIRATPAAFGATAGKFYEAGIFEGDVSDFEKYKTFGVDTPVPFVVGSGTMFENEKGEVTGIGLGGPSLGVGVTASDPNSVASPTYEIFRKDTQPKPLENSCK